MTFDDSIITSVINFPTAPVLNGRNGATSGRLPVAWYLVKVEEELPDERRISLAPIRIARKLTGWTTWTRNSERLTAFEASTTHDAFLT